MHYLLFYEKASDHEQRQGQCIADHRLHVQAAVDRGEVLLAGSLADPVDGASLLLFQSDSAVVAENFAQTDPYVIHGVVSHWRVRAWTIAFGKNVIFQSAE